MISYLLCYPADSRYWPTAAITACPPQQQAHRSRVSRMRVDDGEYHRAQVRAIQPHRQLAPEHPAALGRAAAGNDLDAADAVGVGDPEEMRQCVEGVLCGVTVQVQPAPRWQMAGAQAPPGRVVRTRRLGADGQAGHPAHDGPRPGGDDDHGFDRPQRGSWLRRRRGTDTPRKRCHMARVIRPLGAIGVRQAGSPRHRQPPR